MLTQVGGGVACFQSGDGFGGLGCQSVGWWAGFALKGKGCEGVPWARLDAPTVQRGSVPSRKWPRSA